ncbi:MAG: hypothetical protein CBARDMAM_7235 [uncultured Caballeronia sp.]|nr:MAG: hypothetical protein CBARDMAM_7235 [uncultured Caballeronia sp.]
MGSFLDGDKSHLGLYERFPFAKGFSCVLVDRMGCSTIFGLVAARFAAGHYEIR